MSWLRHLLSDGHGERGAVLVMFAVFAPVLIFFAAFAVDAGNWWVHKRHLQLQADAGALSVARSFQDCSNESIYKAIGQYTGSNAVSTPEGAFSASTPLYNSQVGGSGGHSSVHVLINSQKYYNQATPIDASARTLPPCAAEMADVKITETGLPWYFRPINTLLSSVPDVNAHARLEIRTEHSSAGAEPFVEPLQTPSSMTATLVDESNNDAKIAGPITLKPSNENTLWTSEKPISVKFEDAAKSGTIAVGMRIAMSSGATAECGASGSTCYENDATKHGVTLTRAWTNSGEPGQPTTKPVAPQADDITVAPVEPLPCPVGPTGSFSNFVSTSTECDVQVTARNVVFAKGAGAPAVECPKTVGLKVNGKELKCPASTGLNGKTWTSEPIVVKPNAGLTALKLEWEMKAGKTPEGAEKLGTNGTCTSSKPCTGTIGEQRINSGAYDFPTSEEDGALAGPIVGASLTGTEGSELISLPRGSTQNVGVAVSVLGFQLSTSISSAPLAVTFGGNQGDGALACGGNAGNPEFEKALAEGCSEAFGTTAAPGKTGCPGSPIKVCVETNPGGGKLEKDLDKGMNQRINGGASKCVNPNHWTAPNTIGQILSASPKDPRLIVTIITDNGELPNGKSFLPVRSFATFYVTGWSGDPCKNVGKGTSTNGLAYTNDEEPTGAHASGVLDGHFVKYIDAIDKEETGSGTCEPNSLDRCIAVLTR